METFRTDAFFIYVNNLNEETLTVIEIETLRKFNLFLLGQKLCLGRLVQQVIF